MAFFIFWSGDLIDRLARIEAQINFLARKENRIMAELDDLKKAVQDVKDSLVTEFANVDAKVAELRALIAAAGSGGIAAADVAAVASDLEAVSQSVKDATAKLATE